jgi:hypothetical protein
MMATAVLGWTSSRALKSRSEKHWQMFNRMRGTGNSVNAKLSAVAV